MWVCLKLSVRWWYEHYGVCNATDPPSVCAGSGKAKLKCGRGLERGEGDEKGSCYTLHIMQLGLTHLVCWTSIEFFAPSYYTDVNPFLSNLPHDWLAFSVDRQHIPQPPLDSTLTSSREIFWPSSVSQVFFFQNVHKQKQSEGPTTPQKN